MRRVAAIGVALFCSIAAPVAGWAQSATMWSTEYMAYGTNESFSIGVYGPYQSPVEPSTLLFGSLPRGPVTEVVVEQHVLRPGEQVPLPHYADGTEAREDEVFWTAHIWQAKFERATSDELRPAWPGNAGDLMTIAFSGRGYGGGSAVINPYSFPIQTAYEVDAVVTVVAARSGSPSPALGVTLGQLKAKYATRRVGQ